MSLRNPEQERAAAALKAMRDLNNEEKTKYKEYVAALPATIIMSGFGQALASYMAKAAKGDAQSKESYKAIVHDLDDWLVKVNGTRLFAGVKPQHGQRLIDYLTECNREQYLIAQAETMAYLEWLKKLANALLDETDGGNVGKAR
jgi:CRISPR-associated protein Cmr5